MNPEMKTGTPGKVAPDLLLNEAKAYASKYHFSVFPCLPRAKTPLTPHGCKDASKDLAVIEAWWRKWPTANIGIACGAVSNGLLVLDFDGDAGAESFLKVQSSAGSLKTPKVITGRGFQLYFRATKAMKNKVGILQGLDVRSDGGYVIAPPSLHPTGRYYAWEDSAGLDDLPIASIPQFIADLLGEPTSSGLTRTDWLALSQNGVGQGGRNHALARVIGHLLRRYVDEALTRSLAVSWNRIWCRPPLPESEVMRTFESIARRESWRRTSHEHR